MDLDFTVGSTGSIVPCQYFVLGSGEIIDLHYKFSMGSRGIIEPSTGSTHMSGKKANVLQLFLQVTKRCETSL